MARKLYIFKPVSRRKMDTSANAPIKWLGGFNTDYAYLGDYYARMLGVGNPIAGRRMPSWLHNTPLADRPAKGGASRFDRNFRGWG